jgi:hypothetical protein
MRFVPMTLAVLLFSFPVLSFGDPPGGKGTPPGLAKKGGVPPGLAKKGGLPPGLAKKFGAHRPEKAYVAFDPLHQDRAWFLINGRWVMKKRFNASLRAEVRDALQLPPVPPPLPLPSVRVELRVVLFE